MQSLIAEENAQPQGCCHRLLLTEIEHQLLGEELEEGNQTKTIPYSTTTAAGLKAAGRKISVHIRKRLLFFVLEILLLLETPLCLIFDLGWVDYSWNSVDVAGEIIGAIYYIKE